MSEEIKTVNPRWAYLYLGILGWMVIEYMYNPAPALGVIIIINFLLFVRLIQRIDLEKKNEKMRTDTESTQVEARR